MRMICGAPGGSAAARAFAAAMTSITMKGGADAPRPIFSAMRRSVEPLDGAGLHAHALGRLDARDRGDAGGGLGGALGQPRLVRVRQRRDIDREPERRRRADAQSTLVRGTTG